MSKILITESVIQFFIFNFISVYSMQNFQQMSLMTGDFVDSVFKEISVPQVIIMSINGVNEYRVIEEFALKKLLDRYPTWHVNFWETVNQYKDELGGVQAIDLDRSSALFVSALESNKSSLEDERQFIRNLREISRDTYCAKYLLFFLSKGASNNFKYLLNSAWEVELIDVTIYEIIVHTVNEALNNLREDLTNYFFENAIHQYDPFTNEYYRQPYSQNMSTKVFPYKLSDLHGYRLRIGFVSYPPYSDIRELENGSVVYDAAWGELIKLIRGRLNFTIEPTVGSLVEYGKLLSNGTADGMLGEVSDGKLDVIAFGAFLFYSDFTERIDRSRYLSLEVVCPLVPLISSSRILVDASFLASCLTIIVLVTVIWLFSLVLKPDKRMIWHPLNIIFLILGITVPEQPERLRERFLYGCILVVSLFYSTNVVAQLTSINIDATSYMAFESFEDLERSGLPPMLHPNMYNITFGFGDEVLQRLGRRAIPTTHYAELCPRYVLDSKNVTCVLEEVNAKLWVSSSRDQMGDERMKIASKCYWSATRAYILGKASPYTLPMNRVLVRVLEANLDSRWWDDYLFKFQHNNNRADDENEEIVDELKDNSYKASFHFIIFGHFASFCVFLWEIYSHKRNLKKNLKPKKL